MNFYTLIEQNSQIEALKNKKLKPEFKFFFSLFFNSKAHERKYLLDRGICILYCQDEIIRCGNEECVMPEWGWEKLDYAEFINRIEA